MEQSLMKLLSIDYVSLLLAIATIMGASVIIKEGIERFCKTFGIEFAWIKDREARLRCEQKIKGELEVLAKKQEQLEEMRDEDMKRFAKYDQEIMNNVKSLKDDIKNLAEEIELREAEKRFKQLRYDILNFANKITSMEYISSEMVAHIFEECREYDELSEEYGFENDRVTVSMEVIKQKYQEMLLDGKVE